MLHESSFVDETCSVPFSKLIMLHESSFARKPRYRSQNCLPNFIDNSVELTELQSQKKISTTTLFADSVSDPEKGSPPEEGDEDLHGAEGYSEDDENKDESADKSEIDKVGQQSEEESDQDGEEEL
jgi:hypothetical protein